VAGGVTSTLRVLIIDDSEDDATLVVRALQGVGHHVRYQRVWTAEALAAALERDAWDIAVADYSLRSFSGVGALQQIRQRDPDIPFLFVSGTAGEDAAVDAMKAGATDYIRKGNLRRLLPTVRHQVREAAVRRERRRMAQRVAHLAYHDALTDLPNRTLLHDRLGQAIRAGQRDAEPVALLVLDLDGFKEVNDTYGHRSGDRVLQHVASRIRGLLRDVDTIARLGGDEFAVLLPSTGLGGATLAARKVLEEIEKPCVIEHRRLSVRGSIGIAWFPEHAKSPDTLLQKADLAMYQAKSEGVGIAVHESKRSGSVRRRRTG
jgi:diguanylate cyclase (GGDEF)-like protein